MSLVWYLRFAPYNTNYFEILSHICKISGLFPGDPQLNQTLIFAHKVMSC